MLSFPAQPPAQRPIWWGEPALPRVDALAYVKGRRSVAIEKIRAGRLGNGVDHRTLDVRRQRGAPGDLARGDRQDLRAVVRRRHAQELPYRVRVAERAVAGAAIDAMALDQAVEVMPPLLRVEAARKAHGATCFCVEPLARALEFVAQEAVVEARVVRDEYAPAEALEQLVGERGEPGRARHHVVGDAGERLDRPRNGGLGIDQRRPLRGHL